jgi:hypothetical protein
MTHADYIEFRTRMLHSILSRLVNATPIRSQVEGGTVTDLVMMVLERETAKQLLALAGLELADLPEPPPRIET